MEPSTFCPPDYDFITCFLFIKHARLIEKPKHEEREW